MPFAAPFAPGISSAAAGIKVSGLHMTPTANLDAIRRLGLFPRVPVDMPSEPEAVYLFVGLAELFEGYANWFAERYPEDCEMSVIEVDLTGLITVEGAEFEHVVPDRIAPERILRTWDLSELD